MKKIIIYLIGIFIVSLITLLTLLYFVQKVDNNGFSRIIINRSLVTMDKFLLPSKSLYFANAVDSNLYLKDINSENFLFSTDYSFKKWKSIDLRLPQNKLFGDINRGNIQKQIALYNSVHDPFGLKIFITNVDKYYKIKTVPMTLDELSIISKSSIVSREVKMDAGKLKRYLTKFKYAGNYENKKYEIIGQQDSFFSTDGFLQYDHFNNRIFYMYFYRGEFISLDTNLNILYHKKTVDTVKTAKISVSELDPLNGNKDEKIVTLSNPIKPINRNFTFDREHLYIMSNLKADNENADKFKNNQIVDVYLIKDGRYITSFYIPKYDGLKLREFRIKGDFVFALYKNNIIKYSGWEKIKQSIFLK